MDLTAGQTEALMADALATFSPMVVRTRLLGVRQAVDLMDSRGAVLWSGYAFGPTPVLAILTAEQRFLVEDRRRGAAAGDTYADKAAERIRQWVSPAGDLSGS